MFSLKILKVLVALSLLQLSLANVIRSPLPLITDEAREEFEHQMRLETEELLNNNFEYQIGFFNKVKAALPSDSKRYKDIETFVEKLQVAKLVQDLDRKDELYWNSFKKNLLLNDPDETGIDNDEYQKILEENGIKDLMKNFLTDLVTYLWKMAKHSGKVVEATVDRFVDNMQKDKVVF